MLTYTDLPSAVLMQYVLKSRDVECVCNWGVSGGSWLILLAQLTDGGWLIIVRQVEVGASLSTPRPVAFTQKCLPCLTSLCFATLDLW